MAGRVAAIGLSLVLGLLAGCESGELLTGEADGGVAPPADVELGVHDHVGEAEHMGAAAHVLDHPHGLRAGLFLNIKNGHRGAFAGANTALLIAAQYALRARLHNC